MLSVVQSILIVSHLAASLAMYRPGPGVRLDVWNNVPGSQVTDLLCTSPTTRPIASSTFIDSMQVITAPPGPGVVRMIATVVAPKAGKYRFFVAGSATAALFISRDDTVVSLKEVSSAPAATSVGGYGYYSAQKTDLIDLTAGQKVLVEAIAKTDDTPGCLAVAWTLPDGKATEAPIPASRVLRFDGPVPPLPTTTFSSVAVSLMPPPKDLTPGFNKFIRGAKVTVDGNTFEMSYLLFVPRNYTPTEHFPMLTYLHGMSHQGYDLRPCFNTGPAHNLLFDRQLNDACPMFCMFPQLPPDWRWDTPGAGRIVNELTLALIGRYPQIDRTRLYLTGNSMGGKGTWIVAEDDPALYAAVVPISAVDVRPEEARTILADLPYLHLSCGSDDGGFTAGTHRMYESLKPVLGDRISLQVFEHEGHGVWEHDYSRIEFYQNLLKYHR
jgi:hypothetical protein